MEKPNGFECFALILACIALTPFAYETEAFFLGSLARNTPTWIYRAVQVYRHGTTLDMRICMKQIIRDTLSQRS